MTDAELDELMERAAEGDNEAQERIDMWIARALAPICTTPPLPDEVTWLQEPNCCCSGEELLAA